MRVKITQLKKSFNRFVIFGVFLTESGYFLLGKLFNVLIFIDGRVATLLNLAVSFKARKFVFFQILSHQRQLNIFCFSIVADATRMLFQT